MTITTDLSRVQYNGNGVTTAFTFGNRVLDEADLKVIRTVISTGVSTTLTLNSGGADGYSVAGVGDTSATVNVVTAPVLYTNPTLGETLTIAFDIPLDQDADYTENDPFPAETHERALDKQMLISQQLKELITRSLKFSDTAPTSLVAELGEVPVDGRALVWDGTTGKTRNSTSSLENLETVGTIVADNIAAVTAVADNIVSVIAAATDIAAIITCATNIAAIIAAPTAATAAADSAALAALWATKDDGFVTGALNSAKAWAIGGTGSGRETDNAKYWAQQAAASQPGLLKVTSNDTTGGYLNLKFLVSSIFSTTVGNPSGNETLTLDIVSNGIIPTKIDTRVTAVSAGSGTKTLDLSNPQRSFTLTVSGGANTIAITNPKATGNEEIITLRLTNPGSQTLNWPAAVKWKGGTVPTWTVSGVDEVVLKTVDGGTTYAGAALLDVK